MSQSSNKVLLLGQNCREEWWALAQVIYFTVKGRYMKHICCSICQVYFQLIKDVRGLGLDPAWARRVWCRPTSVFWEALTEKKELVESNLVWHQSKSRKRGYYHCHAKAMGTESPHYFAELYELPWLLLFSSTIIDVFISVFGSHGDAITIISW